LLLPAVAFLGGAALGPGASPSAVGPALALAAVTACLALGTGHRWRRSAGCVLAFAVAALVTSRAAAVPHDSVEHRAHCIDERPVLLRGRLHGLLRRTAGAGGPGVLVDLRIESLRAGRILLPLSGDLRLFADADAAPLLEGAGTVEVWVRLCRPAGPLNFGVRPRPEGPLLARATATELIEVLDRRRAPIDRVRARVARAIDESASPASRGLARALVLGVRDELDLELQRRLRSGGTAHVLAVSGLHVALVSWAAASLARRFGASRHAEACVALAVAWSFAALAGFGLPVLRAAVLASCFSGGRLLGRGLDSWNALAAAVMLTALLRPDSLFGAGWCLTYGATAALLLLTRPMSELLPAPRRVGTAWLRDAFAASGSAWLGLLPVQVHCFGAANAVAPLLNLLAVPVAGLATVASLGGAALACLSARAGRPAFLLVEACARGLGIVDGSAALSPGQVSAAAALTWCGGLLAWALCRDPRLRLAAVLLLLLAGRSQLRALPVPWAPGGTARVTVLDVGQGSSTLVEVRRPGLAAWCALIDGGGRPGARRDVGAEVVVPALRALGLRRLDLVLLSHADYDHRGGLPAVVRAMRPRTVLSAPVPWDRRDRLEGLRDAARDSGADFGLAAAGDRFGPGQALELIWPPRSRAARARLDGNDASLVLRLSDAGRALALLPGDIEAAGERGLVGDGADLRAALLVAPHHGSRTSSSTAFLEAVRPRLSAVSAGHRNRFGHPHPEVLERLTRPFVSAEAGALRVSFGRGLVRVDAAAHAGGGVLCLVGPTAACKDPPP
jgi:competence protein ComEC